MLSPLQKNKISESECLSIRETAEYIASLQFDESDESDASDSHEKVSLDNIKIRQAAEEARVQSERRTSYNDIIQNAIDADPDQVQGSEADKACSMTETTVRPITNDTIHFSQNPLPPSDPSYPSNSSLSDGCPSPRSSSGLHRNFNLLLDKDGSNPKLVQHSIAAAILCMLIKSEYAYNRRAHSWHRWVLCCWKHCEASEADAAITELIQLGTVPKGFNSSYQRGVVELMKKLKLIELPKCIPGTIPFQNGLLDMRTMQLHPINQENATTWALTVSLKQKEHLGMKEVVRMQSCALRSQVL